MIKNISTKIKENNILKNSLILFLGQSLASVIGLLNTILLIKAVGVRGNGIIALVISYTTIFNDIFNFQSYNAVIKFGAEALEQRLQYKYKQVIKQALVQDILTAILAFVSGYLCVNIVADFMGWGNEIVLYIKFYLVTILMNITGVFSGILRLHNKFNIIAKLSVIVSVCRFVLLLVGILLKVKFNYYIFVEIILCAISSFILITNSIIVLKRNNYSNIISVKINFDKEFTKFNFYNNIVSTIDLPIGQLVNFIINKFVGINEVGIYSILVKIGSLVLRVMNPISQSLLPELSRMVAKQQQDKAKKIIKKIFLYINLLGIVAIFMLVLTSELWFDFFMPLTNKNLLVFILYMGYIVFTNSVMGIHTYFISINLVKYNLIIVVIANIFYLILLFILGPMIGLIGIIIALLIQAIIVALSKYVILKSNRFSC